MNVGQERSPGLVVTGLRWGVAVFGARGTAPLILSSVGDLAHGHQGDAKADQGTPYASFDLRRDPLGDDRGLGVLLEIPNVRRHAAPDLEHLPFYALRYLAHYLNCPFIQLMFC